MEAFLGKRFPTGAAGAANHRPWHHPLVRK